MSGPVSDRHLEPWVSLKNQSRARQLSAEELAFARALEGIFAAGVSDFAEVAQRLTDQGVPAPASRSTAWTTGLIEQELSALNASLDDAYARHGIGA